MKIEVWFDIGCDICGRHRSTDFEMGLSEFRKGLSKRAKREGWLFIDGENICPICAEEKKREKERGFEK